MHMCCLASCVNKRQQLKASRCFPHAVCDASLSAEKRNKAGTKLHDDADDGVLRLWQVSGVGPP